VSATHIGPHVRLANDIAAQFRHLDPATAAQEIADHIRAFWDPRMRRALLAEVNAGGGGGLDPLAVAAAALLPPPADIRTESPVLPNGATPLREGERTA
jgi:formate dehydrogenase subunit delta